MRTHTRPFTSARPRARLFALLLLLLGLAAAPLQPALAASTMIDFGAASSYYAPYHEDGFTLTAVANGGNDPSGSILVFDFAFMGNSLATPFSPGDRGFASMDIILTNDAGLPFNLSSIDLQTLETLVYPDTFTIQGTRTDGTAVEQTVTTMYGRQTLLLSNFTNLSAVRLGAGLSTDFVGVDNLILDVLEYTFDGFAAPVDNPPTLNIAKAGQVIPLKWRLTDANGSPLTDLASASVKVASLACSAGTTSDAIEEYAAGGSGLQNLGDGYYQLNWATPKSYAGSCKTLKLDLGEGAGQEHTALFQFK
jgi:hypothetical protein